MTITDKFWNLCSQVWTGVRLVPLPRIKTVTIRDDADALYLCDENGHVVGWVPTSELRGMLGALD